MKSQHFNGFLSLVLVSLILFSGVFFLIASFNPLIWHYKCTLWLNQIQIGEFGQLLSKVSWFLLALGLSFGAILSALNRKVFYQIKLDKTLPVSLSKKVLSQFFQKTFAGDERLQKLPYELIVRKKHIELVLDLSKYPLEQHEALIESLRSNLMQLLSQRFGITQPLQVSVMCSKA